MSTHWTDRLSEYQDGELSPAEHAACEAHLAECDECRAVLQELQLVTVAARGDDDRDPAADLWPGILAQISRSHAEARPSADRRCRLRIVRDRVVARSVQEPDPDAASRSACRSWRSPHRC